MTLIIFVADTHIGSGVGDKPFRLLSEEDPPFQHWMIPLREKFCKVYHNPDFLILNGDMVEGPGDITLGVENSTTSFDEQVKWAIECWSSIIGKNTKVYGLSGSGYHRGGKHGSDADRRVTEGLGGSFKGLVFEFEIGKEKIQISHGSGGGIVNPDAYLRRELSLAIHDAQERGTRAPSILVRSHAHQYFVHGDSAIIGYITPCWQYATRYMLTKTVNRTPTIGCLLMEIDDEHTKVFKETFPIPQEIIEAMRGYERLESKRIKEKKLKEKQYRLEALKVHLGHP